MNEETNNAAAAVPKAVGPGVIARMIKRLPNGPGVYRMIDVNGKVLYVGKARSLSNRPRPSDTADRTSQAYERETRAGKKSG